MENEARYCLKVEDKTMDRWLPVDTPLQIVKSLFKEPKSQTPPETPQVIRYTEKEAKNLGEQLRKKESFQPALKLLIKWLERGMCTPKNSEKIFSLITTVNSQSFKLKAQRNQTEKELRKAKTNAAAQRQSLLIDLREIDHLFQVACTNKVWDRFTNGQRKQIKLWRSNVLEMKQNYTDEILKDRQEDEMELSDEDETEKDDPNVYAQERRELMDKMEQLNSEVESLRSQLNKAHQELSELKRIQLRNGNSTSVNVVSPDSKKSETSVAKLEKINKFQHYY